MATERVLVAGSQGQVGQELVAALRTIYGTDNVIASDIRQPESSEGPFEQLDIMDGTALLAILRKHNITQVYQLAALLSATAEQKPELAWQLNMKGLFNVLDLAKDGTLKKVYWPSSIAVFGPSTPRIDTPQDTVMDPNTVYGISKLAGERWCDYYHQKFGVDVRSLRYPGLIGHRSMPGGGTTDYAVDIYHEALKSGSFECFLEADTALPMMYMPDAIRATIEVMEADSARIRIRSSYNLSAMSFSP
ncbi:MAG: NAD-dependent epimerase/dehydratase family protein, partial [Bacteroidota bacterium]